MATIKSYTDLEQSKKLAEILPLESADMEYIFLKKDNTIIGNVPFVKDDSEIVNSAFDYAYNRVPCWSLAALLDILPDEITDDGDVYRNMFFHLKGKYIIQYPRLTTLWPSLLSVEAYNPVDACYEMIIKLNAQNLI